MLRLTPPVQAASLHFIRLARVFEVGKVPWYVVDSTSSQWCKNLILQQALVAGCNLLYNPDLIIPMKNLNFLSPDSICYSFDHRANGYSRVEGFGVVVVKPLSKALQDGDTIRAVIRATGTNQDGRTPGSVNHRILQGMR